MCGTQLLNQTQSGASSSLQISALAAVKWRLNAVGFEITGRVSVDQHDSAVLPVYRDMMRLPNMIQERW